MTDPDALAPDLAPTAAGAGDGPRLLDWSQVGGAGPLQPCRLCGRPAIVRDPDGKPCHKICAEAHEFDYWRDRPDLPRHHRTHRLAA